MKCRHWLTYYFYYVIQKETPKYMSLTKWRHVAPKKDKVLNSIQGMSELTQEPRQHAQCLGW